MIDSIVMIGYHGTLCSYASQIMKSGFEVKPPRETDAYWLGHGIYFYKEYELARWWAKSKSKKQYQKYHKKDKAVVLKSQIVAPKISFLNLDDKVQLRDFELFCKQQDEQMQKAGYRLDSTQVDSVDRIRCFLLDLYKEENGILIVSYTFPRRCPSYIWDKRAYGECLVLGLDFKELQICVTNPKAISSIQQVLEGGS